MARLLWGMLGLGLVGCAASLQPPESPTSFAVRAVSWRQVELQWGGTRGATAYVLERKAGASESLGFTRLGVLPADQYSFSDQVSPSTTYTYRLRAHNHAGESAAAVQTVTVPAAPPEPPAWFMAEALASDRVLLRWSEAPGAAGYRLERAGEPPEDYAQVAVLEAPTQNYTDTSLKPNTVYAYRLVAMNSSGTSSSLSQTVRTPAVPPPTPPSVPTPPPPPGTLSVLRVSQGEVRLGWLAVPGAEEYRLERSSDAEGFQSLGRALGTTYSDTTVSAGRAYTYRLVAVNAGGVSGTVEVKVLTPPAAPAQFTATVVSSTQVHLTWAPVTGATAYFLQRAVGEAESGYVDLSLDPMATLFSDENLEAGTVYTYRLWARNAGGESPRLLRTLHTPTVPPGLPWGFRGTSTAHQIDLSWEPAGEGGPFSGYRLERGLGATPSSFILLYEGLTPRFTDGDVLPATLYTYRLRAWGPGGESEALHYSLATPASFSPPLRVLFIGNSLTEYPDLPGKVMELAEAAGESRGLESDRVIRLGQSLSDHWNAGSGPETARGKIAECSWDVVVLQERSYTPIVETAAFRQAVGDFTEWMNACPAAHRPKGLLFLNWPNREHPQITQSALDAQTFSLADLLALAVAPVGTAWASLNARYPELELYADEVHPSLIGGYLEAKVLYSSLYGKPPPALEGELDWATAANLAEVAWAAVSDLASRYRLPPP